MFSSFTEPFNVFFASKAALTVDLIVNVFTVILLPSFTSL